MNRVTLITLGVRDLLKAKEFYNRLGFTVDHKDSDDHVVYFETEGTRFSLYPIDDLAKDVNEERPPKVECGFSGITLAYNADSKEAVDALYVKVGELGGRPQCEPQEVFWGGYHFYFRDLDGHYWEVAYAY